MTDEKKTEDTATADISQAQYAQPPAPETNAAPESAPPERRRRGRPPKNESLDAEKIPGSTGAASSARPSRQKKPKSAADVGALAKQLTGLHVMASMMTGIPEVQISEGEATMLASGIMGVADQYDLSIDGKTGAAIQLLAAAAMVYGPRLLAIKAKAKAAKANAVTDVAFTDMTPNGDGQFSPN